MNDRRHLVSAEVEKLLDAAKGSRNAARDRCLLLLMFRHGLRVLETCGLKLSQVDTESRVMHVKRLKAGLSTTHPLRGDELRAMHIAPYGRALGTSTLASGAGAWCA
jgi:type 1 fimbriae regulatory protein FimB